MVLFFFQGGPASVLCWFNENRDEGLTRAHVAVVCEAATCLLILAVDRCGRPLFMPSHGLLDARSPIGRALASLTGEANMLAALSVILVVQKL